MAKKKKTKSKYSLKKAKKKLISKDKYKELIRKRQHHKKLSLSQRKKLDHALFINYCSCIKSLKYNEANQNHTHTKSWPSSINLQ